VIAAPWSAKGAQTRVAGPSEGVEKPRQPYRGQLQHHFVARCKLRFGSTSLGSWSDCEIYEFSRHSRGKFTRGFGGERRPEECKGRKLWAAGSTHVDKSRPGSRLRHIEPNQRHGNRAAQYAPILSALKSRSA
jgi:hypothetical protein